MTGRILLSTARLHGEAWKHSAGNCFWRKGKGSRRWENGPERTGGGRGLFYKLHNFDLFHHGDLSGLNL